MGQGESKTIVEWSQDSDNPRSEYDWLAVLSQLLYAILNTHEKKYQHNSTDFDVTKLSLTEEDSELVQVTIQDKEYQLPVRGWLLDYKKDIVPVSLQRERDLQLYADLHYLIVSVLTNCEVPVSVRRRLLMIYNPELTADSIDKMKLNPNSYLYADRVPVVIIKRTKEMAYQVLNDILKKAQTIAEEE